VSAALFEQFRKNLAVKNADEISGRYCAITTRLNKDYWGTDAEYLHCLQVGSYGRNTAIDGVSDLDMAFELPWEVHDRFVKRQGNIQSQLLGEIRDYLKVLYPKTDIYADGQVVVVQFKNYRVEVLPAFVEENGSYKFPDSNNGGSWCWCWPRDEIAAVQKVHERSNRHLKHICKMVRAWKNKHGAPMGGMLIDTLCYNFFKTNEQYDNKGYACYPELVRDVFAFLANLPEQEYWLAPGSKDRVYPKGKFQKKAKKAAAKCQEALDADNDTAKEKLWREVFGTSFPKTTVKVAAATESMGRTFNNTEQFIDQLYPVDIQYELELGCDIKYRGALEKRLRWLDAIFPIHIGRKLHFFVESCNVPQPYQVFWKVRNVGAIAERRGIRGQIVADDGSQERFESTDFPGPHYVECYVVRNGVCVARDRIAVPIQGTEWEAA
jgi:hypothetical protein